MFVLTYLLTCLPRTVSGKRFQ